MERQTKYSGAVDFARLATEFEALRTVPSQERQRTLAALAAAEPALATELRRLFAQHSEDPEELGSPAEAFGAAAIESAVADVGAAGVVDAAPPTAIGAYRVVRELGRGGMGTVYLGERDGDDFTQRVAIKLLRAPADDTDLQRRFRTERRILAALQHKNIAAMFDGGTTEQGQPYVVMEYVDGPDLLAFCRAQQLPLPARLQLFVKVCRAVAHAHRALVVHRDLKPSNILVGADGEPKLLDFGIAKLLQQDNEPTAVTIAHTATGNMLLTPEYSSPEQVRGEPITTATDVYALGALLYELLSGQRAQPLANRSLTQLIEVVCDRTPPPPSAAAAGGSGAASTRLLRGDLDTIVACAMRKEPERRYASAAALADDLEAFLAGMPVTAQGDTLGYRTRKFVRRHRLALAGTALLFALVTAFAITTAVQNRRIAEERDDAVTQRVVADQIAEFLVGLFEMASPDPERAEALRARELLDRGAHRIATEFETAPLRRAPLQLAMGRAYVALGLYADAEPLLAAATQTFTALAPDTPSLRRAEYWSGIAALSLGRDDDGEQLVRESLAPVGGGPPGEPDDLAGRYTIWAGWLCDAGRYDEADAALDRAEAIAREHDLAAGLDHVLVARAEILRERGDPEGSIELLERVEQRAVARGDADAPRHHRLYDELGQSHLAAGHLDEARTALDRSLQLVRQFAGENHPDVDTELFSIAMLEINEGDLDRAEKVLREILARDEARFGPHHAYPALSKAQLALVLGHLDRLEEAEDMFRDALAMQREVLPPDHPELATTISNFATFLQQQARRDEAMPLFREAYELRRRIYPPDHPIVLSARNALAVAETDRGNFAAAEPELRAVLEARQRQLGEHVEVAGSLMTLATAIARQDRPAEAVPLFEQAVAMFGKTLPADHPTQSRVRCGLGLALMRMDEPDRAEPVLREAAAISRTTLGPEHFSTCYADWCVVRCVVAAGRSQEAIELLRDLETRVAKNGRSERLLTEIQKLLAELEG
ncbi:MAG: serine/threonine protein kinase [Planctomycetes bacterium]|nr:serine/threonine protein kinase [Planctomycetota bacterium]